MADKLTVLPNLVPYLLLGMFVAQVAAVYLLVRFGKRSPVVMARVANDGEETAKSISLYTSSQADVR